MSDHFDHILNEALLLLKHGKSIPEILAISHTDKEELEPLLMLAEELSVIENETTMQKTLQKILHTLPNENSVTKNEAVRYSYRETSSFFTHIFMKQTIAFVGVLVVVLVIGGSLLFNGKTPGGENDDWEYQPASGNKYPVMAGNKPSTGIVNTIKNKIDDWNPLKPVTSNGALGMASKAGYAPAMTDAFGLAEAEGMGGGGDELGFSVGGAKDINNFRENIKNNYLPLPTDITHEGVFYDYYFDTGKEQKCNDLFCPSYSYAISPDPISNKDEYYLSVGLNSNLSRKDFERKKLNLVLVLDISGSMSSPFDHYYYDQQPTLLERGEELLSNKQKMEVAKSSIQELLGYLNDDDRFGMVLFDDTAYLAKPISPVGETDMGKIKDHIGDIQPQGGTNMSAGIEEATKLFDKYKDENKEEYENRIIFLTDAMPNTGDISEQGMVGMSKRNADDGIYTTFIGIGVDFNTELIETLTKIRGANYHSVHSSKEFEEQLDDHFEYMVTPLVFDLRLAVESDGYEIEKVYGSPEANESTGEIMKVNTLFPSPAKDGETKGGIVLLKLKKKQNGNPDIKLSVTYATRNSEKKNSIQTFTFPDKQGYEHDGIRKGILLARYVNLMQNWLIDERQQALTPRHDDPRTYLWEDAERDEVMGNSDIHVNDMIGIPIPYPERSQWERISLPLRVNQEYKAIFREFKKYMESEMNEVDDKTLEQEVEILTQLSK